MKLKDFLYLVEALKKNIPIKITFSSEKEFETRFEAAGKEWIVTFRDPLFADDWEVSFYDADVDPSDPWSRKGDVAESIFDVFSGIANSIRTFIKKINPEDFSFKADPSRVTLYKKFAKMIEKESKYEMIHMRKSGHTWFHFSK